MKLHAHALRFLHGEDARRAIQTRLVDVGHDEEGRTALGVQDVIDGSQPHRAHARQNGHLAVLLNAHLVLVHAVGGVVHRLERTGHAAQRLGQGRAEERFAMVRQQAAALHELVRDHDIGRIAADGPEGVAGRPHGALVVDVRLNGEALAGLELALPLAADLKNLAAELMSHDHGVLRHVVGHALVIRALLGRLIGGHADGIADDLRENFVVPDRRKLEGFQSQVFLAIQAHGSGFHGLLFLPDFLIYELPRRVHQMAELRVGQLPANKALSGRIDVLARNLGEAQTVAQRHQAIQLRFGVAAGHVGNDLHASFAQVFEQLLQIIVLEFGGLFVAGHAVANVAQIGIAQRAADFVGKRHGLSQRHHLVVRRDVHARVQLALHHAQQIVGEVLAVHVHQPVSDLLGRMNVQLVLEERKHVLAADLLDDLQAQRVQQVPLCHGTADLKA